MKYSLVKDEMTLLLENINEQFDMLNQHENMIPQIEIDIFMRNIQKLYENSIYLNRINSKMELEENKNEPLVAENKDNSLDAVQSGIEEDFQSNKLESIKEDVPEKIEDEADPTFKEEVHPELPIQELIQEEVENKATDQHIIAKEEIVEKEAIADEETPIIPGLVVEKEILSEPQNEVDSKDLVKDYSVEFGDILAEKEEELDLFTEVKVNDEISDLNRKLAEARNTQSIVEKLQSKRIESLKSVIGINDKFYFINELFAGDSRKYEDIIYTLNNFKKLEDAMVYFSTLKYKFSWDEESDAYIKLSQMLERKFQLVNA